jgi:hypothetical protein
MKSSFIWTFHLAGYLVAPHICNLTCSQGTARGGGTARGVVQILAGYSLGYLNVSTEPPPHLTAVVLALCCMI